jgi:hypothetical protein
MKKLDKLKMLKEQYHVEDKPTTFYGREIYLSKKLRNTVCRVFSTKQEKAFYFMHLAEYKGKYPLRLRARRGKALVCAWEDLPSSVYEVEKCWKNNSRRKNQWYRIAEM